MFNWSNPYPTPRIPVFGRNLAATSHPLGAQAGLRMLLAGGNAVDAAVAAAAMMTIVEPVSNGLGSDAFAMIWDGQRLHGLNGSGHAPLAWDLDYFQRKHGGAMRPLGWDAVTVPGAVGAWVAAHQRFGRLSFADCLAPAIEIAERGHAITPVVQHKWAGQAPGLRDQPGFARAFLPRGRAPEVGERFCFPEAADTLRRIAATAGQDFYQGETAERLIAHAAACGGAMTLDDLRSYQVEWVEPLSLDYRGYTVHELPPNGQGITALIALGILRHFGLSDMLPDSVEARHVQIEAIKLAFADVYQHVTDARSMRVSPQQLLDDAYLSQRARAIDPRRAQDPGSGLAPKGGTIYLTTADESGMMVSWIQSNYLGFGSGVVVPGTGVSLQNRGMGFSLDPNHVNCVAPRKRPFHTIIPAFVSKDGAPCMSFGVMGANMQPQGHVQTLTRMIDWKQNPQTACDAPRWRFNRGLSVDVEASMAPEVVAQLVERGHRIERIEDPYLDFGAGQFIWRLSGDLADGYVGASDPRRDGLVAAF